MRKKVPCVHREAVTRFGTVPSRVFRFFRTTDRRTNAMSDLGTIGMITALLCGGAFLVMYINRSSDEFADIIITGVQRGLPISSKHRRMIIWNQWLPVAGTAGLVNLFIAIAMVQIGKHAGDADIALLAYLAASFGGFGFALFVFGTVSGYIYFISVLRETSRE